MRCASLKQSCWSRSLMMPYSEIKNLNPFILPFMAYLFAFSMAGNAGTDKAALKLDGKNISVLGRSSCQSGITIEIELPTAATNRYNNFRATRKTAKQVGEKRTTLTCADTINDNVRNEGFNVNSPEIPAGFLMSAAACQSKDGTSEVGILCIYGGDAGQGDLVAEAEYSFDTSAAKITGIKDRSALNGKVTFTVQYSGGAGTYKVEICYGKTSDGNIDENTCPSGFLKKTFSSREVALSDLDNDFEYGFRVCLLDSGNQPSGECKFIKEKPVKAAFPLQSYNGKGGELQFSCQQSNGSSCLLILFALVSLAIIAKRRDLLTAPQRALNRSGSSFLLVLLLISASDVKAGLGQINVGLLGAMYRPDLDSEKLSSGEHIFPFYKCFFRKKTSDKDGPINPLMGIELDFHLWDDFGSLQLGLGAGYTFTTGKALRVNANDEPECDNPIKDSKVSLHMYQLRPQLTYIFNPFAEYFPIVPYVRGALIGHGYMFFNDGKSAASSTQGTITNKANGFRFGYQGAVGLMLMMDFLEPNTVAAARGEGFFEHVYLKGELSYTKIDTFGRSGYQFSAKDVMGTKLPLMWTFGLVFELP